MIRQATDTDTETIAGIYNHYIENTVITFEESVVSAGDILARMEKVRRSGFPWLVAEDAGVVIGYAYASKWHERSAYRHTAEVTVYLSHTATGKGRGTKLYEALFAELRTKSIHVAIGGITLPNPASVALHEKFGMTQAAHYKEVGYKFERWLDVGYWQVKLEN